MYVPPKLFNASSELPCGERFVQLPFPKQEKKILAIFPLCEQNRVVFSFQVVPRPTQYARYPTDEYGNARNAGNNAVSGAGDALRMREESRDYAAASRDAVLTSGGGGEDEEVVPGPTQNELNLYDSLAAELRAKLGGDRPNRDNQPILLPPKDYDTVHRSKGKLLNMDEKKATNERVVGDIGAGGLFVKGYTGWSGGGGGGDDSARGDSENGSLKNSQNEDHHVTGSGGVGPLAGGVDGGAPWSRGAAYPDDDLEDRESGGGSDRNNRLANHKLFCRRGSFLFC